MSEVTFYITVPLGTKVESAPSSISLPFEVCGVAALIPLRVDASSSMPSNLKAPESSKPLEFPIAELGLSARAENCLEAARIKTLGDLVRQSASDLMALPAFGKGSLRNVEKRLSEVGAVLRRDGQNIGTEEDSIDLASQHFAATSSERVPLSLYVVTPAQMTLLSALFRLADAERTRVWFSVRKVATEAGYDSVITAGQQLSKLSSFGLTEKSAQAPHGRYRITDEGKRGVEAQRTGMVGPTP